MVSVRDGGWVVVAFYLMVTALAVGAIAGLLPGLVNRSSEGFVAALLIAWGLQVVRIDRRGVPQKVWLAVLALGLIATGPLRDVLGLPGGVATLQESFAGALIVSLYLMRPVDWQAKLEHHPSYAGYWIVLGLLFVVGAFDIGGPIILDHAESLAIALLVAAYFDFVSARSIGRRVAWAIAMLAIPFLYTALNENGNDVTAAVGGVELWLVWFQRTTEAFVCVILLQVYDEALRLRTRAGRG